MTTSGHLEPAPAGSRLSRASNLQLRALTAAIGLPVVGLLIWVGGWAFAVTAGLIALLAAAEFVRGWLLPSLSLRALSREWMNLVPVALIVTFSHTTEMAAVLGLGAAALMAVIGWSPLIRGAPRKPYRVYAGAYLYCGVMLATLVLTRDVDDGRAWVFLGILATFATDTGAYAVGRSIGRHKLAPSISPAKTREGAVGGWVAGAAAVFALNALFDTGVSAATIAPLALLLPIAGQAGDLFESWMKRRMGIKDSSALLPGHGGVLDRLDSILFVMPLLYLFLRFAVL